MNRSVLVPVIGAAIVLVAGCAWSTGVRVPLTVEQALNREAVVQRLLTVAVAGLEAGGEADLGVAEDALRFASEIAPDDRRVLDGLGAIAWRRCRVQEAKELFQRAIAADPAYSRPYAHLALVAEAEGDVPAARALLRAALARNPLNYRARAQREALELRVRERGFAKRSVGQVEGCLGLR